MFDVNNFNSHSFESCLSYYKNKNTTEEKTSRTSFGSRRFIPSVPTSTRCCTVPRGGVTRCGMTRGGVARGDVTRGQMGRGVLPDAGAGAGGSSGGLATLCPAWGFVPTADGWRGGLLLSR